MNHFRPMKTHGEKIQTKNGKSKHPTMPRPGAPVRPTFCLSEPKVLMEHLSKVTSEVPLSTFCLCQVEALCIVILLTVSLICTLAADRDTILRCPMRHSSNDKSWKHSTVYCVCSVHCTLFACLFPSRVIVFANGNMYYK